MNKYYWLALIGGVSPVLSTEFLTEKERDQAANLYWKSTCRPEYDSIVKLDSKDGVLSTSPFMNTELE